jgi:hypothetical protein
VKHEVVITRARNLERIELQDGEAVDHRHDAVGRRRQGAWRAEEMPVDQVATGDLS